MTIDRSRWESNQRPIPASFVSRTSDPWSQNKGNDPFLETRGTGGWSTCPSAYFEQQPKQRNGNRRTTFYISMRHPAPPTKAHRRGTPDIPSSIPPYPSRESIPTYTPPVCSPATGGWYTPTNLWRWPRNDRPQQTTSVTSSVGYRVGGTSHVAFQAALPPARGLDRSSPRHTHRSSKSCINVEGGV